MNVSLPTKDDLKQLSAITDAICLSITLPTEGANADPRLGMMRMKNLLRRAEAQLREKLGEGGKRVDDAAVDAQLKPLWGLTENATFWRHQDAGLAIFSSTALDGGQPRVFRTPFELPEEVIANGRFHMTPLLPFFSAEGHFLILALGKKGVRLFEASRGRIEETPLPNAPSSFEDIQQMYDHERAHHLSPGSQGRARGGNTAYAGHGLDAGDRDEIKRRVLLYLQQVNKALVSHLGGRTHPLILVALEYLHPLWREACTYKGCSEAGVKTDAEILSKDEIYKLAWPHAEQLLKQHTEQAVERYQSVKGNGLTATNVKDIVHAAREGRVEALLISEDLPQSAAGVAHRIGRGSNSAHATLASEAEADELLDLAVAETLTHGGDVIAVPADKLSEKNPVVGVLRY